MVCARPASLRWRLAAAFGLALVGILAAGRYVQYRVAIELLARDIDAQLWARLGALKAERRLSPAAASADALKLSDTVLPDLRLASDRRPSALLRLVMPVAAHESLAEPVFRWFASVWADDGSLLAAAELPADVCWDPGWRVRGGRLWTEDRGRYRLAACSAAGEFLVVGTPLDALDEARREVFRFHLVSLAVVAPLLVGLLMLLLDRLLRPLTAITNTAERIRGGEIHERIDLSGADAEIAGMAATINAMLDRLEEGRGKQARFNADLAHEVLGPVHGILLATEALQGQATGAGPAAVSIGTIRDRAERIEALCDALLAHAQTLAIAASQLRPVDLEPVVALAVEQVTAAATGRGVTLRNEVGSVVVRGQADLLRQVFVNLLANAVGHSPPGAEVRVVADCGPAGLRVRVIDRGPGVTAADAGHVFERFFARPPAGTAAADSHGIGLSLAREIMRGHEGDLTFVPTPGGGATFVATFPACDTPSLVS